MLSTNAQQAPRRARRELLLEWVLFASRWILAPLYVSMTVVLAAILVVFLRELLAEVSHVWTMQGQQVILFALSLVDLSLTANLLLIVIFAGYENFVSKIHVGNHEDRPTWMGTVDFSGLKIKLIASIVIISAIALLRVFLPLGDAGTRVEAAQLRWMVIIHLTFVISGVLLAAMDWVGSRASDPHRASAG
jgi:uncharacterized protein (TIGR00645 family)